MSNYPRNFPNLNHPNWSARTPDRRAELDWPYQHDTKEPGWLAIGFMAVMSFAAFVAGFWLLVAMFG